MAWMEIQTQEDIDFLMDSMGHFHDSCIKELWYTSGAFADEKGMYPINSKRKMHLILQGRHAVELVFYDLVSMYLNPVNPAYTCEILGATLILEDGDILFLDNYAQDYRTLFEYEGVGWVRAQKLRWRIIDLYFGQQDIYHPLDSEV